MGPTTGLHRRAGPADDCRTVPMLRRTTLLTQVLAVNAAPRGRHRPRGGRRRPRRLRLRRSPTTRLLVLGLTVTSTILLNSLLLRYRLEPVQRIVRAMSAVDLSRPGMRLPDAHRAAREVQVLTEHLQPACSSGSSIERRDAGRAVAARAGAGARADRPGPPRRGQPGAHRDPAAPLGDDRLRALRAALGAAGDAGASSRRRWRSCSRSPASCARRRSTTTGSSPRSPRRSTTSARARGCARASTITASSRRSPTRSSS